MSLVSFKELMDAAQDGRYAVGYFESWDKHSLLAVADAARITHSPVLMGFSGRYLSHPERLVQDPLSIYAAIGLELCTQLPVPAALVYNESPDMASVLEAAGLGFGLVMYSDERIGADVQLDRVKTVTRSVHLVGAAVEGEIFPLPGVGGLLAESPTDVPLTGVEAAVSFVTETGVDALAVNLGQVHLHGREHLRLDLERLRKLKQALSIPLVLHGASSIRRDDLKAAIDLGIVKVNVGSKLKQIYFETLRDACDALGAVYNPYVVVGSGLDGDVLTAARLALREVVADLMVQLGSAGKA